jgi:vanillate monooxygenase ferredoxin subunit
MYADLSDWLRTYFATAEELGWAKAQLHRELFVTSASAWEDCDREFEVQIARMGSCYLVPRGRTVMEILETNGVHIRNPANREFAARV